MTNASKMTGWELVRQARALHPEWTVADHVANLYEVRGEDIDPIWVARWLRNLADEKTA